MRHLFAVKIAYFYPEEPATVGKVQWAQLAGDDYKTGKCIMQHNAPVQWMHTRADAERFAKMVTAALAHITPTPRVTVETCR